MANRSRDEELYSWRPKQLYTSGQNRSFVDTDIRFSDRRDNFLQYGRAGCLSEDAKDHRPEGRYNFSDLGRSDLGRSDRLSVISNLGASNPLPNLLNRGHLSELERSSLFSDVGRNNPLSEFQRSDPLSNFRLDDRFSRLDRPNFESNLRGGPVTPWQQGASPFNNSNLSISGNTASAATLALATNMLSLLQPQTKQNLPSLMDMPVANRSFGHSRIGFRQNSTTGNQSGAFKRRLNSSVGPNQQSKTLKKDISFKDKLLKTSAQTSNAKSTAESTKKTENNETVQLNYDNIKPELLKCAICKKAAGDGNAFLKHITGKRHAARLEKISEIYATHANLIREKNLLHESKKSNFGPKPKNYNCTMCNIKVSNLKVHRSSIGHKKLKNFIHPSCKTCKIVNMASRLELDKHLLSPEHMRKFQKKTDSAYQKKNSTTSKGKDENDKDIMKSENVTLKLKDDVNTQDEKEAIPDSENLVLDYMEGDDLTDVTQDMIPAYNKERAVGDSFLTEHICMKCKLCNKLFDTKQLADWHLRSREHHRKFAKLMREKIENNKNNTQQKETAKSGKTKQVASDSSNSNDEGDVPDDELEDWDQWEDSEVRDKDDDEVEIIEDDKYSPTAVLSIDSN